MDSSLEGYAGPAGSDLRTSLQRDRLSGATSAINWLPWAALAVALVGLLAVPKHNPALLNFFFALGYFVALIAAIRAIKDGKDVFNPLTVLIALMTIRFSIPAVILLAKGYATPEFELFRAMQLREDEWVQGHAFAVLGMVGLSLGWSIRRFPSGRVDPARFATMPSGIWITSTAGALIGLASLMLFVSTNVGAQSFAQTIGQGSFRGVVVQQGTGKFFVLSLLLIASSVTLTSYLLATRRSVSVSLIPVILASAAFFFLGGRARAGGPLAAGLLLVWYSVGDHKTLRHSIARGLKWLGLAAFVFVWIAAFGQLYRGGGGLSTIRQSFSDIPNYLEYGALVDFGQLHALAAASRVEPGILEGTTFVNSLLWPISDFVGLGAENPGALLVRETLGVQPRSWALQSAIIGDSYLNFGVAAIVVMSAVLGFLIREAYARLRSGRIRPAVYVLFVIYAMRVLLEGITKWPELLVITVFSVALIRFSYLFSPEKDTGRSRERPWVSDSSEMEATR